MRWGLALSVALWVGGSVVAASLPEVAVAQVATPPDLVRMLDGSFVRGTIVEATPERVVIQLVTGEVRTIPRGEVAEIRSDALGPSPQGPSPHGSPGVGPSTVGPGEVVPIAPFEQAPVGPQVVVRLRLGEMVRGTLVEDAPGALTLRLADGTTRTVPRADVAAIQPVHPPSAPRAEGARTRRPPPSPTSDAELSVEGRAGLSLHRVTGTAAVLVPVGRGMGTAAIDAFALVCGAPCTASLPPGDYRFGVAQGDGQPSRAAGMAHLGPGHHRLAISYDDRGGFRIAGWLTFGLGAAASAALMSLSLVMGPTECTDFGFCRNTISVPMLVSGAVLFGVSMGVGLGFAFLNDAVEVRVR